MPLDWTTGDLMVPAGCLPCCVPSTPIPTECACALLIPPFATPYADYATAEGVVTDPLVVADCLIYQVEDGGALSALSASFDGTTLSVSATATAPTVTIASSWASISAKSGATFTFTVTGASNAGATIYDCNGTTIETLFDTSPVTSAALPADGVYYIAFGAYEPPQDPPVTFSSATIDVTSSDSFTVNPVIALWDDSGTTRQLEACPKMYLPPLTESTGDWYVDCAEADAVLTDPIQVSNCVGYCGDFPDSFTATDSGSILELSGTFNSTVDPRASMYGSINLVAGATVSASYTITDAHSFPTGGGVLYDDTGTAVETIAISGSSGTLSFSAVPYTGRYIIKVSFGRNDGSATDALTGTFTITSSGTLSVNEIQALYDVGLTCAGRLNCGDACP